VRERVQEGKDAGSKQSLTLGSSASLVNSALRAAAGHSMKAAPLASCQEKEEKGEARLRRLRRTGYVLDVAG